jgi:hypothetical protein
MNWLKVGAVVIGGIVVFFVVGSVIHVILGLLTAIVFVALVAGGIYAAAKIAGAKRRRELRKRPEYHEEQRARHRRSERGREAGTDAVPATDARNAIERRPPHTPAAHHDVEDDLARLKREMDS